LIEDIDAEVDKLVVLEGFYEPLPYVPFFTLRDDEDLSSNEDEEIEDLTCKHHLHRKSRSSLTGKLSPMALEISTRKGLPWLHQSFIDKNEKMRVERLYKLRKSIIKRETLSREALARKQFFFTIHRQSSLKNIAKVTNTLEGEEVDKDIYEESKKLHDIEVIDDFDKDNNDHDHTNHEEHNHELLDLEEFDDKMSVDSKPKETLDINIQKLTCNQFELDFKNVIVGEKKEMSLKLYNGANFPVTFKVDKTRANSKGFNIQPDQILVLPSESHHNKATTLQITFQNMMPKLPLGPIHVWVQMNVKEVQKLIDLYILQKDLYF